MKNRSNIVKVIIELDGVDGFRSEYGYDSASKTMGVKGLKSVTSYTAFGRSTEDYADAMSDAMDQLVFGSDVLSLDDEDILSNQYEVFMKDKRGGEELIEESKELTEFPTLGLLLTVWIRD